MLEQRLGQRPGLMLAASRVLLAAAVVALSTSETGTPGFKAEPDDLIALGYLGCAIAALVVYWNDWWLAYRIRRFVFAVDFLAYAMIMYLIEPMQSGLFAASITLLAFLAVSVAIQWGWKQAVIVIVLLNLFCLAMIVQMLGMDMPIGWAAVIRRQAYQLLISFFLAWAAGWVQRPRVAPFLIPPGLAASEQFSRALEFACQQLHASYGALCWAGQDADSCNAITIGLDHDDKGKRNYCSAEFVQLLATPILFDLERNRGITLCSGRLIPAQMLGDEREFARRFGIKQGLFIPLVGTSGKGRVVLGAPALAGADMLRFASEVGSELGRSFDSHTYYRSLEVNAAARVRNALARDLHDNVAQSFAGARYWLDSLLARTRRGETVEAELQEFSLLVSSEHAQILGTIEYLRKPAPDPEEDLVAELEALADTLSKHWQVAVALVGISDPVMLPADLTSELKAICREAVSNAVRHGQANKIALELNLLPGELMVAITNDGTEFNPSDSAPKTIDARVRDLNGRLDIVSKTAETRISIAIPLGA